MASVSTPERLLTAEEFEMRSDSGEPEELVRGRIVPLSRPDWRHGQICVQIAYLLRRFFEDHPLGHVVGNDSGVITQRDPDSVRGPAVAFYSFAHVPRGPLPHRYHPAIPEVVFEVLSPSDRWPIVLLKVGEYLLAGVTVVLVLDDQHQTLHLYRANGQNQILTAEQELTLPDVLEGFRVMVKRFFE